MILGNSNYEKMLGEALNNLYTDIHHISLNPSYTLKDKMRMLQAVQKNLPVLIRLMVRVETERTNK